MKKPQKIISGIKNIYKNKKFETVRKKIELSAAEILKLKVDALNVDFLAHAQSKKFFDFRIGFYGKFPIYPTGNFFLS